MIFISVYNDKYKIKLIINNLNARIPDYIQQDKIP